MVESQYCSSKSLRTLLVHRLKKEKVIVVELVVL